MRAAERRLAATAAREGVATADLYPRITISGMLGLLAGRGNIFGTGDSRAWAVTPALQWSAFDLGSARARLRGAHAATAEALAELRTDDAAGTGGDGNRARQLSPAAGAAGQAHRRGAREREGGGHRPPPVSRRRRRFLSLLDAERTQLQAEDSAAQAEADVFTAIVGLYRAVGGMR